MYLSVERLSLHIMQSQVQGLGLRIFSLLGQNKLDGKRMKLENSFKHIY